MKRLLLAPLGALLLAQSPTSWGATASPAAGAEPPRPTASKETVDKTSAEWIAAGDSLRAQRKWAEALSAYEQASKLNAGAIDSRLWELRCWLELGRINDALDGVDALAAKKASASALDYLYGMAFVRKAEINVAAGITDSTVTMNFGDAVDLLSKATQAEPTRFADAFPHLAQAAYNSQRNELALEAAEQAVAHFPDEPKNYLLQGRIALSLFVVARGDGSPSEEADASWNKAITSFRAGAETLGTPQDAAQENALANLYLQQGYAYGWKSEHADDAASAFGLAIEWDPAAVDYQQIWGVIGIDRFLDVASAATERFIARAGEKDARAATPLWFLGHAHFQKEAWEPAEKAFQGSVDRWPNYSAAWFYIGRARYARGDYPGAIAAFRNHWKASPEGVIATINSDAELNISILDWLVGKAAESGNNLDAAFLSEVLAQTVQTEPRYWNNSGLFLRDEGEKMLREAGVGEGDAAGAASLNESDTESAAVRAELFERAYAAYTRALELQPDDPALLNDTALMLHYHLKRDLDKAAEMYRRSHARAEERLASEDLSDELRSLYEIALRDSKNNLARLEQELADG